MRGPPARHPNDDQREQLPAPEGIISAAEELKPGDRVVYPNQGVCAVVGWEEKDIAGQKLQLVRMAREEDGAAVMVPKGKVASIGLRRVATGEQMEGVFHYLAAQFDDPELDWKVRHRDNADRLIAGGVLGVAEVVKGLHSLSRLRPLPAKEREQYDNARHLLVHEVAVSLGVPAGLAEDYIDYALMPPVGVKFDLKPPPTPVLMPSRPKKRRVVVEEDETGIGDLGLGELGLGLGELDLEGALEAAPEGEPAAEGGEAADGEGAAEATPADEAEGEPVADAVVDVAADEGEEEDEEEEEPPPPPRKAAPEKTERKTAPEKTERIAPPAKTERKTAPEKTERKAAVEKAPARKAAKKPSAEKAPARKATAKKPAPARKPAPKKAEKRAAKREGKKK